MQSCLLAQQFSHLLKYMLPGKTEFRENLAIVNHKNTEYYLEEHLNRVTILMPKNNSTNIKNCMCWGNITLTCNG